MPKFNGATDASLDHSVGGPSHHSSRTSLHSRTESIPPSRHGRTGPPRKRPGGRTSGRAGDRGCALRSAVEKNRVFGGNGKGGARGAATRQRNSCNGRRSRNRG